LPVGQARMLEGLSVANTLLFQSSYQLHGT